MRHVLSGILVLIALAIAGCGDAPPPDKEGTTPGSGAKGTAPPPTTKADTPHAIGEAVSALYVDTLKKVTAALESRPEAAAAKVELERIKAQAVEQFVQLGRKRAALDDAGKAIVNQRVRAGLRRVPSDLFEAFSSAHKHYMGTDRDAGNLLASFNVITQYAEFELLKKQAPKEYERLRLGE